MVTFDYNNEKISVGKTDYIFTPRRVKTGDPDIDLINMNGVTQVQQKRIRNDGSLKLFGFILSNIMEDEKTFFENLSFGKNKACVTNTLKITVTEEHNENGTYLVVPYDPDTHYEQAEMNEDLDLDELFYKLILVFISISN